MERRSLRHSTLIPLYLLDTCIVSDAQKTADRIRKGKPITLGQKALATRMADINDRDLRVCLITIGELLAGAEGSENPQKSISDIQKFLSVVDAIPTDEAVARQYGLIRSYTKRQPIGQNDAWIAAHASRHGCLLVTHNTGEFSRIPGLLLQDWLSP